VLLSPIAAQEESAGEEKEQKAGKEGGRPYFMMSTASLEGAKLHCVW
jgi:hypothetical protein